MPTLRRAGRGGRPGTRPGHTEILVDSASPYGSRRVSVECDGSTTTAYMHDQETVLASVWLANHRPAPPSAKPPQLPTDGAPVMPAGHTKHPAGTPPPNPRILRALWFEEGDGVAIVAGGQLVAVIPSWADSVRGMPGYSRDAIGQTPFAWSLDDAMEGLGPRADRATAFWRWRASDGAWASFQKALLGHLLGKLGPGARYWDVGAGRQPLAGVSERPPTRSRPFTVLSTLGMSCQRMPAVERYAEDASTSGRIELALATTMPSPEAARIFLWLAQYPWRAVTWFGTGHSVRWYHEPATFPLGRVGTAVLLLGDPARLPGPEVPDLGGFTFGGDPVHWLWVIPISERERLLGKERGAASLVNQLAAQRRSWVVTP